MAEIKLQREHTLGLARARAQAQQWAAKAEREWGVHTQTQPGADQDVVHFKRSGVHGQLRVSARRFELEVQLSALLGPLAGQIERGIRKSLDDLLGSS